MNDNKKKFTKYIRQRLSFEDLLRKRRISDHARYVETFRRNTVDPNPHQIQAVAFAIDRLENSGGAILCDEVGLGKTIETGLLLTQLRAEGKNHILILVPISLSRQWQVELQDLFGIKSVVLGKENLDTHQDPGVYIAGREFAGSKNRASHFKNWGPWDLIVVDEAHEVLGSIYQRFNSKTGEYNDDLTKGKATRAGWLKTILDDSPNLLLTATPLQNNLLELWSLVHFADKSGTALGDFAQFSAIFTEDRGRSIRPENANELRERLQAVICRTLRSQAQPFLKQRFTARSCETIDFRLRPEERLLYEQLRDWLSGETSLKGQSLRKLILRRRMSSSIEALASSLAKLKYKLENPKPLEKPEDEIDPELLNKDLQTIFRLEEMAREALQHTSSKKQRLLKLVQRIIDGEFAGVSNNKVVIFTESRVTLLAIVDFLNKNGFKGQVTSFSGKNDSPEALKALSAWQEEVACHLPLEQIPKGSTAMRGALVHEFKHHTRIFVATEAGAKGLNLQFCNCLVNFDMPWNPQRIEQRIGRVHRYGQKHDVVIVNFINLDNAGEQRVYELLRDKLQLFEGVLGASDKILGQIASFLDFENRVNNLLNSFRTVEEQNKEFDRLAQEVDEATKVERNLTFKRTGSLIAGFDEDVRHRLRLVADELPIAISHRDDELLNVLRAEAVVQQLEPDGDRVRFEWLGKRYHLGPPNPGKHCGEPLSLDHPIVKSLYHHCLVETEGKGFCCIGTYADWAVYRVVIRGLEKEERIVVTGPDGIQGLTLTLNTVELLTEGPLYEDNTELARQLGNIKEEVEREQSSRLKLLLKQLKGRGRDHRRLLESKENHLHEQLKLVNQQRIMARTADELNKLEKKKRKLHSALTALNKNMDSQIRKTDRIIFEQQAELTRKRYVDIDPKFLFSVSRRER